MELKTSTIVLLAVVLVAVTIQAKDHKIPEKEKHDHKEEPKKEHTKKTVCERERVQCGAGRECVEDENGEPTCQCTKECKPRSSPVCGSNGKSYENHCEMHREACVEGIKMHVKHEGYCVETPTKPAQTKPVVCYQNDRDKLRQKMIDWMISEEIPDGWFSEGKSYNEVLKNFFNKYDETGDGKLDSNEMLKLVEGNDTVKSSVEESDLMEQMMLENDNSMLRGLCVDALIDISDEDADWVLDLKEFENCMNPEYKPPHRSCSLEDEFYEDGAETKVKCNSCVCACGNWVCTAMSCDDEDKVDMDESKEEEKEEEEYDPALDFPEEMTEEEFQEYLRQLGESDDFKEVLPAEKEIDDEEKEIDEKVVFEPIMDEKEDSFEKKHDSKQEEAKDKQNMSEEKF